MDVFDKLTTLKMSFGLKVRIRHLIAHKTQFCCFEKLGYYI